MSNFATRLLAPVPALLVVVMSPLVRDDMSDSRKGEVDLV